MFFKKSISIAATMLFLGALPWSSNAQPLALSSGHNVQSTLQQGSQTIRLEVPAGHVVQLRFTGVGLHLDLKNAQGQHIRRLAEDGRGVQTAMWVTQGSAQEQLVVTAAVRDTADQTSLPFELQVLHTWPTQGIDQPKPDETPMGPRLQALQQALARGENTDAFWQEVQAKGTPWVEPWSNGQLLVTFLWRDQNNRTFWLFW